MQKWWSHAHVALIHGVHSVRVRSTVQQTDNLVLQLPYLELLKHYLLVVLLDLAGELVDASFVIGRCGVEGRRRLVIILLLLPPKHKGGRAVGAGAGSAGTDSSLLVSTGGGGKRIFLKFGLRVKLFLDLPDLMFKFDVLPALLGDLSLEALHLQFD